MTPRQQRFCPLCDRSFSDSEAVLRCEGCGVLHHPACWVKNGGCATKTEHQSVPTALAYAAERSTGEPARHPGEGTRVAPQRAAAGVTAGRPPERGAPPPPADEGPIIGADTEAETPGETPARKLRKPPVAPKRYVAGPGGHKTMPSLYGRHRILGLWYIPAALLVAVGVAIGVIWLVGQFTDDGDKPSGATNGSPTSAVGSGATATAAAATLTPAATQPSTGGKFQVNDAVVITGAGAGSGGESGCLNVRTAPGTDAAIIDCLPDGTQLTILGGPQEAGGLTWWNVKLQSGNGWAAEQYLAAR